MNTKPINQFTPMIWRQMAEDLRWYFSGDAPQHVLKSWYSKIAISCILSSSTWIKANFQNDYYQSDGGECTGDSAGQDSYEI